MEVLLDRLHDSNRAFSVDTRWDARQKTEAHSNDIIRPTVVICCVAGTPRAFLPRAGRAAHDWGGSEGADAGTPTSQGGTTAFKYFVWANG